MSRQKNTSPPTLQVPQGQKIVITGHPENMHGAFYIRNTGQERISLHTLPLSTREAVQVTTRTKRMAESAQPAVRVRPGVIRPGQSGPVSLSLSLDPYTPPGEYQAEVDVAGQTQPVVMLVTEKVLLRISPPEVVVENLPGQKIKKQVVLSNRGNVSLHFGEFGAIYLDDELLVCRTLRAAAASVDDELRPLEEYLATILLSAKHVAESSGILRVHNLTGEITLQPGETRAVDLEIRVPQGLDKRGRYLGVLALYTASLSFVIVPSSGPPVPEENPPTGRTASTPPRRRAGKNSASR